MVLCACVITCVYMYIVSTRPLGGLAREEVAGNRTIRQKMDVEGHGHHSRTMMCVAMKISSEVEQIVYAEKNSCSCCSSVSLGGVVGRLGYRSAANITHRMSDRTDQTLTLCISCFSEKFLL